MSKYYLNRDRLAWQYKEQPGHAWSRMTNAEIDLKSIKKYLRNPEVSFVTTDMKPANFFEVQRNGDKFEVALNGGEKNFNLYDWDFVPFEEAISFFHDRAAPEVIAQADTFQNLPKVEFYKRAADLFTQENYKNLLQSRMTNDVVKQRLMNYDADRVSLVFFAEDDYRFQKQE